MTLKAPKHFQVGLVWGDGFFQEIHNISMYFNKHVYSILSGKFKFSGKCVNENEVT